MKNLLLIAGIVLISGCSALIPNNFVLEGHPHTMANHKHPKWHWGIIEFDICTQDYYPSPNHDKKQDGVYSCYTKDEDPTYNNPKDADRLLRCKRQPKNENCKMI